MNICIGSAHSIVHDELGYRKVCAKWIPPAPEWSQQRVDARFLLLARYERERDDRNQIPREIEWQNAVRSRANIYYHENFIECLQSDMSDMSVYAVRYVRYVSLSLAREDPILESSRARERASVDRLLPTTVLDRVVIGDESWAHLGP